MKTNLTVSECLESSVLYENQVEDIKKAINVLNNCFDLKLKGIELEINKTTKKIFLNLTIKNVDISGNNC